jgi:uncharacterized membrane protein YfcA
MILSLILGMVVGLVMGLTGAGGGILAVPLLVFGLQFTVPSAGPIGLLAVGLSSALGAFIGLKAKLVRYKAAMLIAAMGIIVTPVGSWLARQLDTRLLSLLFAIVLLIVAYKNFKESRHNISDTILRVGCPCIRDAESGRFVWTGTCAMRLSLVGSIAGLLSGLLGVGGGFVIVPALQRFTDLSTKSIVATSLAVIALISISAVATSIYSGHFSYALGIPFSIGAIVGMLIGGVLVSRWSNQHLKMAFALVCMAVSIGLTVKALA